jgi:Regulator of chromosome condensation (RCC1) repeat
MINAKTLATSLYLSAVLSSGCEDNGLPAWFAHQHGHHGDGHHHPAGDPPPCDASLQTSDAGTDASSQPGTDSGVSSDGGPASDGGGPVACAVDQFAASTTGGSACVHKASAVAAGFAYTCAMLTGGGLKCWGHDDVGVLGYGTPFSDRGDAPSELGSALPLVALGTGLSATQVFAASDLTCAVLNPGSVKCWGYDGYMATGSPMVHVSGVPPDQLPERTFSPHQAVAVTAGSGFGSAILDDGSVTSWGNSGPSFGSGVAVSFDRSVSYDNWHSCAVLDDGSVACSGVGTTLASGALGYLNSGAPNAPPPAVELGTGRSATAVATGSGFSCALLDDQTVKCWGVNALGQLGQGDTTDRGAAPSSMGDALTPLPLGQGALAITAGVAHACTILVDHTVRCWGSNDAGQLGIGSTQNIGDQPGEVAGLAAVDLGPGRQAVAIDAGGHTCVVLDNGGVKCWGNNAFGQLGQGDTITRGSAPAQLGADLPEIDLGP